jgi:hypothetical protein
MTIQKVAIVAAAVLVALMIDRMTGLSSRIAA